MTPRPPARQARDLLASLGITDPAQIDLPSIADHLNVQVRFAPLDGCAATIIGVGSRAIITVSESGSEARQRFSIAHEIGHWIYDRERGINLCETQDLNIPWNGRTKASGREKRANRFAAELLMPVDWFTELAHGREMSFETVETLRKVFGTSRTSTAIRLVELGSLPAMLVMFDANGRRKWYTSRGDAPDRFYPCLGIPRESGAASEILRKGALQSGRREVDGDLWIDHRRAFDLTIWEQAIRVRDNVLVIISWDEDEAAELTEDRGDLE